MILFGAKKDNTKEKNYLTNYPKESNGYDCKTCTHFCECGNASYTCEFGKPKLVVNKGNMTNEYYWCKGKEYKSKY